MDLPVQSGSQGSRGRNYERAPWCYLHWGIPVVVAIRANEAHDFYGLTITATGALWVTAVAWAGIGCLVNG
jgi:hypothetical protein